MTFTFIDADVYNPLLKVFINRTTKFESVLLGYICAISPPYKGAYIVETPLWIAVRTLD